MQYRVKDFHNNPLVSIATGVRVLQRPRRAPWTTTLWPAQLASWLIGGPDIGEHKQHGREKNWK